LRITILSLARQDAIEPSARIDMALRDILLQLNSYPEPTPTWAIDRAADMAGRLGAKLSIGLCQVYLPDVSNLVSQLLVRSRDIIGAENEKSAHNAANLRRKFETDVPAALAGEAFVLECPALATGWQLAQRARAYDLTIVPFYRHPETRSIAEALIFETGRPVLLLPAEGLASGAIDNVVIGWDGSRSAARALAEATVLCEGASSVTVVTVAKDKDMAGTAPAAEVVRHLARHGIEAMALETDLAGANAGDALNAYCRSEGADLLVMGGYGHTRLREFVLGGATRSVLDNPAIPVLFAH
jgi:nucleotide-binding universal stress UspA family protein